MKKFNTLLLVASLFASPLAFAQGSADDGYACQRPDKMQKADANHDGSIDKAEAQAMHDKHFDDMDKNKDGKLSKDEVAACQDKDHKH